MRLKFNFTKGSATRKGEINTLRIITKDHTVYPLVFDKDGNQRPNEELENMENAIKTFDQKKKFTAEDRNMSMNNG